MWGKTQKELEREALRQCGWIFLINFVPAIAVGLLCLFFSLFRTGPAAEGLRLFSLVPPAFGFVIGLARAVWTFLTW